MTTADDALPISPTDAEGMRRIREALAGVRFELRMLTRPAEWAITESYFGQRADAELKCLERAIKRAGKARAA